MSKLLRTAMWLLLATAVVWALVIGYWKIAGIRPDARDLVLYLGVLPLGVFAVLSLLKRSLDVARDKSSAAQDASPAGDDVPDLEDAASPGEPGSRIAILGSALQLPAGHDVAGVLASLAEPATPELHDRLKDGSGFPVFASWVEDVDTGASAQALEAAAGGSADKATDEQLRAFGLLIPVAQDLLVQAVAEGWLDPPATDAGTHALPPPDLKATLFVPAEWPAALREQAAAWLADEALASGVPGQRFFVEAIPASGPDEVWRHLATLATPSPSATLAEAPALQLLLACHSAVGERSVQRLEHTARLLSVGQPEGVVPGEGAAGLIVSVADAADGFAHPPKAILRTQSSARKGVSWQMRTAVPQIETLLDQTLARAAGTSREDLKALVCDADQRRSRSAAIAGFVGQVLGHLDPETDCVSTGAACGHSGIVSPLALVALAAERAAADEAPVLALAVAEPDQRTIALLLPPDSTAADDVADSLSNPQTT